MLMTYKAANDHYPRKGLYYACQRQWLIWCIRDLSTEGTYIMHTTHGRGLYDLKRCNLRANTHTDCQRQGPMMSSHACPHNACTCGVICLCSVHLGHMPSNLMNKLKSQRSNVATNIIILIRSTMNRGHFSNKSVSKNHRNIFRSLTEYLVVQNLGHLKTCERLFMIVKISMDVQIINRVSRGSKPWTLKNMRTLIYERENKHGCRTRRYNYNEKS